MLGLIHDKGLRIRVGLGIMLPLEELRQRWRCFIEHILVGLLQHLWHIPHSPV